MPIYNYKCNDCTKETELLLPAEERDNINIECPYCGGELKRIPAVTNFQLVGKGWAKDGYSREKK